MFRFVLGIAFTIVVIYVLNSFYKEGIKDGREEVAKGGEKSE